MRKLTLDLETLDVQSFQTEDQPVLEGTVFGAMTEPNDGCTGGAECNTYPGSACEPCMPSMRGWGCGASTYYGCTYTDYVSCGGTCAPCA
jgi:hypothetical protein